MRARAREVDLGEAPPSIKLYVGQVFVTPGIEYEVHAVSDLRGTVFFLVIDDLQRPRLWTEWLFEICDPRVPDDWICSYFRDEASLVLGPAFIAGSVESHDAVIDADPDKLRELWQYIERQTDESP